MSIVTSRGTSLFSLLFFFSGAAGLVYEVAWTRLLRLPMGNTVHSMTAVLAAFMSGLALGAAIAGRWIDRRGHPLRVYALLEACIGAFCLSLPWIVAAEVPFLSWADRRFGTSFVFDTARFLASALVVLVPATLMGATLPVLCRYFIDRPERVGVSVGWLYSINALGAAAGALVAGFVLIPWLGVRGTIFLGVATSLGVAAVAGLAQRRYPFVAEPHQDLQPHASDTDMAPAAAVRGAPGPGGGARAVILLGYGISGLAAMALQIAWARVVGLVVGSSTYAFSLLVGSFILGLALGSQLAGRLADRLRNPLLGFALAEIGIGFTALVTLPILQAVPGWMLRIVPSVAHDFARFQLVQFALVFAVVLLPTVCMGAAFPLVSRALVRGTGHAAGTVGNVYAANTLGTIVGALVAGFVLVPWLGLQGTIFAGVGLALAVGSAALAVALPRARALPAAAAALGLGGVAMGATPRFDPVLLTSGAYIYAHKIRERLRPDQNLQDLLRDEYAVLFHREGLTTTVTVRESLNGQRSLLVNGKADASDQEDMPTQALSGHIVCLLHPAPRDVAVIGLASGVSLHAVGLHPTVRSIDCIEIAPEMLDASRFFAHVNGNILDDPRVQVILQDGRNHLALTDRSYDVIVSEPSNPWMAGIASLYTREFFATCRERLRPEGLVGVFLHMYSMDLQTFRNVVRTFAEVFPQVSLWETIFASDYLLVGSKAPLNVNWEDLSARLQQAGVAADVARVGVTGPAELLAHYVAGPERVQEFARSGHPYDDDHDRLEFEAPRLLYHGTAMHELQALQQLRRPGLPEWLRGQVDPGAVSAVNSAQEGQKAMWEGIVQATGNQHEMALRSFYLALERIPRSPSLHRHLIQSARQVVSLEAQGGGAASSVQKLRAILALQPDLPEVHAELGLVLAGMGRLEEAEAAFRRAHELEPRSVHHAYNLGLTLAQLGRYEEAEPLLQAVLERRPGHVPSRLCLGNVYVERGDLAAAELEFRAGIATAPSRAEMWIGLGEVLLLQDSYRQAVAALEHAIARAPEASKAHALLGECYGKLGEPEKAATATARARALGVRP